MDQKPYYYFRNGLLHIKHVVDECVELSETEKQDLKAKMTERPYDKQNILADEWFFQTKCLKKKAKDGKDAAEQNISKLSKPFGKTWTETYGEHNKTFGNVMKAKKRNEDFMTQAENALKGKE